MLNRTLLITSSAVLAICSGCIPYPNHSVFSPWSDAPPSPVQSWSPPKIAKLPKIPMPPEVPTQEEPLTLAEVVDVALKNNTQTQITWAQARQAAAQYAQTQSSYFPEINGQFYYNRERTIAIASGTSTSNISGTTGATAGTVPSSGVQPFYFSQWGPQLAVSYTVWDFGQRRATSETARFALYFADWTHNRMIQTVIQTVTTDYYNYLYQKQLLDAYVADVETAQITLDAAQLALETGTQDISDVLQAKSQLLQNQTQWAAQRDAVKVAYATLLTDMGLPASQPLSIHALPDVDPQDAVLQSVDQLLSEALDQRADLLAAQADLRSKEYNLRAAWSQFWPTIDYNFNVGKTYFNGGINDGYDFTSFIAINIPIFQGLFTLNGVRLAEAQKKQSQANLRQVELNVVSQIVTSHYNVKIAFDTLKYSHAFLDASKKEYEVAINQYKVGVTNILTVISAQSSLATARATLASSLKGWFTALSDLAYATGVLSENQLPTR